MTEKTERKQRGQVDRTVMFPVASPKAELPEDYSTWLAERNGVRHLILVEYALWDTKRPITVAEWETKLTQSLPDNFKGSLPSIEELEAGLGTKPSD